MNTRGLETALAAFTADATYWGVEKRDGKYVRKLRGPKDDIRGYIGAWISSVVGGITYEVLSAEEWGDCVLIKWRDVATDEANPYHNEGIMIFEFNDRDEIVHARSYQDNGVMA